MRKLVTRMSTRICDMDSHALRQFNNPSYSGTQITFDPEEFCARVNDAYSNGLPLVDGYAPFCKHLFVENFCGSLCGYSSITPQNERKLRVCYESRCEEELPVLITYFDKSEVDAPVASHLDIILYSREQITEEYIAMGKTPPDSNTPWGIISIKSQMCGHELPMQPITMMRNALGKSEGGSGVPLDRSKYLESVSFWKVNATIK